MKIDNTERSLNGKRFTFGEPRKGHLYLPLVRLYIRAEAGLGFLNGMFLETTIRMRDVKVSWQ